MEKITLLIRRTSLFAFPKNYYGDEIKAYDMDGAYNTIHLDYLSSDETVILRWAYRKYSVRALTGFMWFVIGSSVRTFMKHRFPCKAGNLLTG